MSACTVVDCKKTLYAKGLCKMHYDRLTRTGSLEREQHVVAQCSVEGCSKKVHGKGLCQPHYRKLNKYGDPTATRPIGRPRSERSTDHRKLSPEVKAENKTARKRALATRTKCANGHAFTPENTYVYPEGHQQAGEKVCKICRRDSQRKHLGKAPLPASTPVGVWNRDKTHCPQGHEYTKANTTYLSNGNRKCRACSRDEGRMKNYGVSSGVFAEMIEAQDNKCLICKKDFGDDTPNIDHCHVSGGVRGLLCQNCNLGLGKFMDNPEFLMSAINYLKEYGYEVITE